MDREVGYCQGSAFIVGLLLMQVITEVHRMPVVWHSLLNNSQILRFDFIVLFCLDARRRGFLCVCEVDARLQITRALQTQYGWTGTLHVPVWVHDPGRHLTLCDEMWYSQTVVMVWICLCYLPPSQEQLPELHMHFQAQSFHTSMYASSWFLTIFLTSFPLPVATRIFDIFMCEVS